MTTLHVLDGGEPVRFSFDDLVRYHGRGSIGGAALGFKVMERGFPFLDDGQPPERREIQVETAFDGPGARDAFELVTRAVTENRYRVLVESDLPTEARQAPEAPQGRFFFGLRSRGRAVDLTLRAGHVSDEFIQLVRRHPRSPEEEAHLASLKQQMADRLMPLPAESVFDAHMGRERLKQGAAPPVELGTEG